MSGMGLDNCPNSENLLNIVIILLNLTIIILCFMYFSQTLAWTDTSNIRSPQ